MFKIILLLICLIIIIILYFNLVENFAITVTNTYDCNNFISKTPSYLFNSTNNNNQITDISCFVLPIQPFYGILNKITQSLTISNNEHGYEMLLINYPLTDYQIDTKNKIKTNMIYISDLIKNNFNYMTIVNTNLITAGGIIKINTTNKITKNIVQLSDNNLNSSFNKPINILQFIGKPRIIIYGGINSTDTNIYIYLDYNNSSKNNNCINKLIFNNTLTLNKIFKLSNSLIKSGNILPIFHGIRYTDTDNRNFKITFNPNDNGYTKGIPKGTPNGFITVIDTYNSNISVPTTGSLAIDTSVITNNSTLHKCITYNFYVCDILLSDTTNWISNAKLSGPYSSISFNDYPTIILYIPPFVFPTSSSSPPSSTNQILGNGNNNFQSNPLVCNIYINMIYSTKLPLCLQPILSNMTDDLLLEILTNISPDLLKNVMKKLQTPQTSTQPTPIRSLYSLEPLYSSQSL
jgi:hypothetical protein